MTTLSLPARRSLVSLRAIGAFLANLVSGVEEGRAIRDRYDRLSRLSNRELSRRGLDRLTIAQAAARGFDID